MPDDSAVGRFGSGRDVKRIEDAALLAGAGRFADDVSGSAPSYLVFLRSPHAHARIVSIDTAEALAMPGVIAVLTGADLVAAGVKPLPLGPMYKGPDGSPGTTPRRRGLAHETVRFVGEAVAAVLAGTREQAKDAVEAVAVDYEELPVVTELSQATAEGAPQLWPEARRNIAAQMIHGDAAATDAAFARAAHVVALDIVNQRLAPTPLEPRSSLGEYDAATDRLTLRLSTQMPSGARDTLCNAVLGIPTDKVRVVVDDVGGGFGMKTGLYAEDIVVAYLSRHLKRTVKWTAERIEEFLAATHGRDVESHAELALDADGKVLGYRVRSLCNMGGYAGSSGVIQLIIGPWVTTSIYDIRTIHLDLNAVLTNTAPTAAYRGAGRPEAIYLIERLFDVAARKLSLDPAEIRRRNLVDPSQMPYTNAMGQTYDSGKFGSILEQGLDLAKWSDFPAREAQSRAAGKLRGRGLASFLEWTGGNVFEERVTVAVSGDGTIEVYASTMPMGQGIATSYAQLVVDVFGVPIEQVRIVMGDTDRGSGFGSAGSRSLFTAGSAINHASERAVATGRDLAGDALEAAAVDIEYVEGVFQVAGTDRRIGLFELAARQPDRRIFIDATSKVNGPSWPNGCHIAEVEVDPDTGVVQIVSYVSANDVGRAVNPMIVLGQLDGGAVQGIGQALGEHMRYDPDSGQAITASFMDYAMPRADIVHGFVHVLDQSTPCLNNPLGVKGVGELGTIGATPAVVNAVADALIRAGRADEADRLQMPLTPLKVWQALAG
ncbi:MAG TPA: xanthine dehydrogenase family protein molybdopterin-binding subunit [Aliidongia sp.]|uniref:xanthine dehydrogenase family protein molybdopterin-binding subunit n=1 Tax=Aliidongia sp. TaxID=1914230 RepID=UPI002DDD8141|nr:xanthine dehydrogenase family protein molybdopterin-binding subunit [Aliidongia sp.]HEV2673832.1 xanthine dehydrogenase family protein molybdopterin-binding subunit [Aliidongia sp.]